MAKKDQSECRYWLMKSEPSAYSIDDLARDRETAWTGIRNYQVRNFLRDEVKKGDMVLFYHSSTTEPGVVGEMRVVKPAYPDPTQLDPKSKYFDARASRSNPPWLCVDVRFKRRFKNPVSLKVLRTETSLTELPILKPGNRLSVVPVTAEEYEQIIALSKST
jgi:predicted RNA-binding protein with PUA-like domain